MIRKATWPIVLVAILLLAFAARRNTAAADPPTSATADPEAEFRRAKFELRLDHFAIQDATFDQALDHLRQTAGVNIVVQHPTADWVSQTRKATLALSDVDVGDVLRVLLSVYGTSDMHDGPYDARAGVIYLGGVGGRTATYVYDISDFTGRFFLPNVLPDPAAPRGNESETFGQQRLADPPTRAPTTAPVTGHVLTALRRRGAEPTHWTSQECIDALVRLVEEVDDPNSWRDNGGQVGSIRELGGLLFVTNTLENQVKVQRLLKNLRAARERLDRGGAPTTQPLELFAP